MSTITPDFKHVDQSFMRLADWFKGSHSEEEIRLRLGNVSAPEKYDDVGSENQFNSAVLKEKELRVEDTVTRHEPLKQKAVKKEYKRIKEELDQQNHD